MEATHTPPMPGLADYYHSFMAASGAHEAARLSQLAQAQYASLYTGRPLPAERWARWHVTERILPGLALYRTFLELGWPRAAAIDEVHRFLVEVMMGKQQRFARLVVRALHPLGLARPLIFAIIRRQMRMQFSAEGFAVQWHETSPQRLRFDMTRCLYLKTLKAHDAPELTRAFCRTDDVLAEALRPAVAFTRTKTMGHGDAVCDFCYAAGG